MKKKINHCFKRADRNTTLRQAQMSKWEFCKISTLLLICCTRLMPGEGFCYLYLIRNNSCQFISSGAWEKLEKVCNPIKSKNILVHQCQMKLVIDYKCIIHSKFLPNNFFAVTLCGYVVIT